LIDSTVTLLTVKETLEGDTTTSTETQGSGFVIEVGGERVVVTANHVIDRATEIVFLHPSGARGRVTAVIAADDRADVAVLEVEGLPEEARPLQVGGLPEVGSDVVLVSSPLGLEETLAFGNVAAHRKADRAIQLAAGVSAGSSGGLVADRQGRALAVIRAKASIWLGAENIAWATPMRFVARSLEDAKRRPLVSPNPEEMVEQARHEVETDAGWKVPPHPATASLELKSGEALRNHVCIDTGDSSITVALHETEEAERSEGWRVGQGRACATFAPETPYEVLIGTDRVGQTVTLKVQRQRTEAKRGARR
jgi:S1-C subfamily serine protease